MIIINEMLDGSRAYTQSTDGKSDSARRVYEVTGTDSETVAGNEATILAPNQIILPNSVRLSVENVEVEPGGIDDRWLVTVNYSNTPSTEDEGDPGGGGDPSNPQPSLFSATLDTSGGEFLLTSSFGTNVYAREGLAQEDCNDYKSSINVDKDGNVNGVNVTLPQLRVSRTVAYPRGYITNAFIDILTDTTGKVNEDTFFGRQPGEVLLTGVQGEDTGQPVVQITFNFIIEQNAFDLKAGDITYNKGGHEFVWFEYTREAGRYSPITGPRCAYVEKVYRATPFSVLAIPGA